MVDPTYSGNVCPHCRSFVPEGARECGVCHRPIGGREHREQNKYQDPKVLSRTPAGAPTGGPAGPTKRPARSDEVQCDGCGSYNDRNATFCKVCGVRLVHTPPGPKPQAAALVFEWSGSRAKNVLPKQLSLAAVDGFELLAGSFRGLDVFVTSGPHGNRGILLHAKPGIPSRFYLRMSRPLVLRSGATFYLGSVAFSLRGTVQKARAAEPPAQPCHPQDEATAMLTIAGGPGVEPDPAPLDGPPIIVLPEFDPTPVFGPVEGPLTLSRSWVERTTGYPNLHRYGLSERAPVQLSPLTGGFWLLEPFAAASFYLPIGEPWVLAMENDWLRLVEGDNAFEARLSVEVS